MGKYHNKLDEKYFKNSIYMKKFYETFDIKDKDKRKLQYNIVYNTLNTFVIVNNYFFTSSYTMKYSERIDKSIEVINNYLNTYKNKIKKCYDKQCIAIYEDFYILVGKLEQVKIEYQEEYSKDKSITYPKIALYKEVAQEIDDFMTLLEAVNFDNLMDSKDLYYMKAPNDKLPRKVNCKINCNTSVAKNTMLDEKKQESLNNEFIANYYKYTDIDLNKDIKQKEFIFTLHNIIKDFNNAIVDYYMTNDMVTLKIFLDNLTTNFFTKDISFVEDIKYRTLFKKLKAICDDLWNKDIDIAYNKLKEIIKDYQEIYEFMS